MNDDTIQDLKQFLVTTISQQTSSLATKDEIASLEVKVSNFDVSLTGKIYELF